MKKLFAFLTLCLSILCNVAYGQNLQVSIGNDTTLCSPDTIALNALASGGGGTYSYIWSNSATASSIIVPIGKTIKYTVTVSDGTNTATDEILIQLAPPLKAHFNYYKDAAGINFYSSSSSNATEVHWDFGNGTTSSYLHNNVIEYSTDYDHYYVCLTVKDSFMCEASHCFTVYPHQLAPCHVQFDYFIQEEYNEINFYNYSAQNTNTQYVWNFGDGQTSTEYYPWHEYQNSGTYELCLTVTDASASCSEIACKDIVFIKKPMCSAYFSYMFENIAEVDGIQFNNYSEGVDMYLWDFGDGNTSSEKTPFYAYDKDGTYNVCLTATNSTNQCTKNHCMTITITSPEPCFTDFYYNIDGANVSFNNKSYNEIYTKYLWDFGDNTTSDLRHPMHTYTVSGNYQVCLTVTDSIDTCTNSYCQNVYVTVDNKCYPNFYYVTETSGIRFINYTYNHSNYLWDFGDGTSSTEKMPTHKYPEDGNYEVKLYVSDNIKNCSDSSVMTVTVEMPSPCKPEFSTENKIDGIKFLNYSKPSNEATYYWSFGDGNTSSEFAPLYKYTIEDSTYNVCLTINDPVNECEQTKCLEIFVAKINCIADFYFEFDNIQNKVNFFSTSIGENLSYAWYFGDGGSAFIQNPSYQYTNTGEYNVCLNINNPTGCKNQICKYVYLENVNPNCNANFEYYFDNEGTHFNPMTTSGTAQFSWSFGNGATSTAKTPVYKYTKGGEYNVCLMIIDEVNDCFEVTECKYIYVQEPTNCTADFYFEFDNIQNKVNFFSTSIGENLSYAWYFGDGGSAFIQNPSYQYTNTGEYNVCLNINNPTGCQNQICKYVYLENVNPNCNANFEYFFDSLGTHFNPMTTSSTAEFYWDFGNEVTSSGRNPIYKYTEGGKYNVCLMITDEVNECFEVMECKDIDIKVEEPPTCYTYFEFSKDALGNVNFYNYSDTKLNKFIWSFGDGVTSSLREPTYKYPSHLKNTYACLLAIDTISGCTTEYCNIIQLEEVLCKAEFYYFNQDSNYVYFENFSQGENNQYYWDFGDGKFSTEQYIEHNYANAGTYKVCLTVVNPINNCSDMFCQTITVGNISHNFCIASFMFNISDSGRVFFNNYSQGELDTYHWNFGDGKTASQYHAINKYVSPGVYYVCLTVSNSATNCSNTYCQEVVIKSKTECKADFKFNKNENTISFINTSSTNANKYKWLFGDGTTSAEKNPVHNYAKAGIYNVCLTIFDTINQCQNMYCQNIYLEEKFNCSIDFNYFIDSNGVNISSIASGAFKYMWNFGNGYQTTQQNPVYKYANAGQYNICVSVIDTISGCVASKCVNININIEKPCFAQFMYYISNDTVYFDSETFSNSTKTYWTFGDGKFSNLPNPYNKYTKGGTYNVCLNVNDTVTGCKTKVCKMINIGEITCKANFKPFVDMTNNKVFFADMSTGEPSGWYWNFGDGTASTLKNPEHTYAKAGNYVVTLTINNKNNNCIDVYTETILIGTKECKADFNYSVNSTTKEVSFENISTGNIAKYYWSFGNGKFSIQENPSNIYSKGGMYEVCLLISDDSKECISYECKKIQVEGVTCKAEFNVFIEPDSNIAYFTGNVTGAYSTLYWEFGDGGKSVQINPAYKYKAAGYYAVSLTSYDSLTGCMSKSKSIIMVNSAVNDCEADFLHQYVGNSSVYFYNNSQGNNLNKFIWNFGDGTKAIEENTTHTYMKGGYYNVCLTAIDSTNPIVANTTCKVIKVGEDTVFCKADFMFNVDAQNNVKFEDLSLGNPIIWKWNFDDNNTSTIQNPSNKYASIGYYLVHLKIQTQGGKCKGNDFKLINVNVPGDTLVSHFGFIQDVNNKKANSHPVDFIGASFGDPAVISWDFGDGTKDSTTLTPTHEYLEPGTYTVCLTIADPVTGQADVSCQEITVKSIDDTLAIEKLKANEMQTICYPNPFNDNTYLFYNLATNQNVNVVIYDMLGNKVRYVYRGEQYAGKQKLVIARENLNAGIYYLNINTEKVAKTIKLVIVK